jgi:hypothetical protein
VVRDEKGREFGGREVAGNGADEGICRGKSGRGGGRSLVDLGGAVTGCFVIIDVKDNSIVDRGAGNSRNRHQGAVGQMPRAPKIDGGRISVPQDNFGVGKVDGREVIVIKLGFNLRRSHSKKGDVEGPHVFEGRFHAE